MSRRDTALRLRHMLDHAKEAAAMKTSRRGFFHRSGVAAAGLSMTAHQADAQEGPHDKRPRLNPWRLEPVDLRRFMRLGVNHILEGAINRRRGCLPFVRFNLTDPPTWGRHEYWGSPHMVGRFLDALALCADIVDVPDDEEAISGLRKLLHDCLDNPSGLAFDTLPSPEGKKTATMHHCREVLLGLVGLFRWRGCEKSAQLARDLVRTVERVTRESGTFPAPTLTEEGWGQPDPQALNQTSGRLIGALMVYYRATRDDLAVDLAKRFADINIEKTFTPDGTVTELAGTHLHSTEGTMASLIDLGVVSGEQRYFDLGRRLYDVGLRRWRTSFGWAKESRRVSPGGRGEANNIGDFIAAALTLALNGHREYFGEVERFIRNGLLASQVINTDWIVQSGEPDTDDYAYSDIRQRARGAFAFTTPNGYHSYNTDLMGGSLRALCEAYHASVMNDDSGCRVNMLFTTDTPWLTIRSSLPQRARLGLQTRGDCKLLLRLPSGVNRQSVSARVNGKPTAARWRNADLFLDALPPDAEVVVTFEPPPRRRTQEQPHGWGAYDVTWVGDTVTAISPSEGPIALY